jgi:hypothetical protein
VTVIARCLLHHPLVPFCIILPKYEKESGNPSPCSLLTSHVFAQHLQLVAVRQGVCCCYLTSSCKYALFGFLKRRLKDQTGKKLTNKLLTEGGASWHLEPTSPTLRVPTFPLATFLCFRLHHPQTQRKPTIISSSNVSQKKVPLTCGTISRVAIEARHFIQRWKKRLPAVEKIKH